MENKPVKHNSKYYAQKYNDLKWVRISIWLFITVFAYLVGMITPNEFNTVYATDTQLIKKEVVVEKEVFYLPTKDEVINEIVDKARENGVSVSTALDISWCESKYNPLAVGTNNNGSQDVGVFQINDIHGISKNQRLDYKFNIQWAIEKMAKEGFKAWNSSSHCWK